METTLSVKGTPGSPTAGGHGEADARGQNGTKHWNYISELLERKLGILGGTSE